MTNKQLKSNEDYFKKCAMLTSNYIWMDKGHQYDIENGEYIASNEIAFRDLKNITPTTFHSSIKLKINE